MFSPPILSSQLNQMNQQLHATVSSLKIFISKFICSKIESHIKDHGPSPDLFPACRAKLDSESALWLLLEDKIPASVMLPSWSDCTY